MGVVKVRRRYYLQDRYSAGGRVGWSVQERTSSYRRASRRRPEYIEVIMRALQRGRGRAGKAVQSIRGVGRRGKGEHRTVASEHETSARQQGTNYQGGRSTRSIDTGGTYLAGGWRAISRASKRWPPAWQRGTP